MKDRHPRRPRPEVDLLPASNRSAPGIANRLAAILATGAKRVRALRKSCRAGATARTVHRLRVALRRMLATLDLAAGFINQRDCRNTRKIVKDALRTLGPLRDAVTARALAGRLRPRPPNIKLLTELLRRREKRLRRKAGALLRPIRPQRALAAVVAALRSQGREAAADSRIRLAIAQALRNAHRRIRARWPASPNDDRAFHRARIAVKRYRYQLEVLAELARRDPDRTARSLQRLQRRLGELHDCELLVARAQKLAQHRKIPSALFSALQRPLQRRISRLRRTSLAMNPAPRNFRSQAS